MTGVHTAGSLPVGYRTGGPALAGEGAVSLSLEGAQWDEQRSHTSLVESSVWEGITKWKKDGNASKPGPQQEQEL